MGWYRRWMRCDAAPLNKNGLMQRPFCCRCTLALIRVGCHRWAGAVEVAVAVDVVDAVDAGPELVGFDPGQGEDGFFAAVGAVPFAFDHVRLRMRGILERVVVGGEFAGFDAADFVADADHRGDEAVEFGLGFRFGRLDHDGAGDREGDGRGVEAVVHQTLGDVDFGDSGRRLDRADIQNALVRDAAIAADVKPCLSPI